MENENKDFLNELDALISLFEKLRQKAISEGIILENDPMYKNFELLAGNYKLIKNNIPPGFIDEMGDPIKKMIQEMVEQLKAELGIDKVTPKPDTKTENSLIDELKNIDGMLKNNDLSEDEINKLLDKRTKLNDM